MKTRQGWFYRYQSVYCFPSVKFERALFCTSWVDVLFVIPDIFLCMRINKCDFNLTTGNNDCFCQEYMGGKSDIFKRHFSGSSAKLISLHKITLLSSFFFFFCYISTTFNFLIYKLIHIYKSFWLFFLNEGFDISEYLQYYYNFPSFHFIS